MLLPVQSKALEGFNLPGIGSIKASIKNDLAKTEIKPGNNKQAKLNGKYIVEGRWSMFAEWELSFKDGRLVSTAFDGSNGIDLEIGKDIKVTRVGPMLLVNYYGGPYSDAHLVYGLILTIVEDTDGKPPALRLLEAYEVVQDGKGEFGIDDAEKVSFTIIPADIKAVE